MANVSPIPQTTRAPSGRMTLASVKRGRLEQPLRVLLFGSEGIGKSTFGANAPAPIFLCAEDGTAQLDVARFAEPKSWGDVLDAVRVLTNENHEYQTLVIDTLDWIEPLCWTAVCERSRKPDIEAFGYGKGYVAALEEWRVFVSLLEGLRKTKSMHIVLLAHSLVRTFKNPEGDDYDRYSLKIHEKAAGLFKEWCTDVLFANYETHVLKEGARGKGYGGGARVVHTERRAAWDAKNRHGLPERMALDWDEYASHVAAFNARQADEVTRIRGEIEALLPQLPAEKRAQIEKWLTTDKAQKADNLRVTLNKANELIAKEANQ